MSKGPILTTLAGNLPESVWMCSDGEYRCEHLSVHDAHYRYCSAYHDEKPELRPGAGAQILCDDVITFCPYLRGKE